MDSERIKQIQQQTAYPGSHSVQQALLQVWNECAQEYKERIAALETTVAGHSEALATIVAHAGSAIECVGEPGAGYLREICETAEAALPADHDSTSNEGTHA